MADIIDTEEIDKDTVEPDVIEQLFSQQYKLLTETSVSLKKSYINKLHGTKSLKLAVSQTDNSIEVYELNNTSLTRVCRLSGHEKTLTEVVFSPEEDHLVYSSGQDGLVKLWDTRASGGCVHEYKEEEESEELKKPYDCMDVSCNGKVLCAGSLLVQDDAYLVFWDQRMPAPLGGYWNTHTDDISQVKFHPTKSEILASGSLDGLLNIYNIVEATEDDALTYSLNVEDSVATLAWLGERLLGVSTGGGGAQLWDAATADRLAAHSREKVARTIKRSKADDCYLVDMYAAADGAPALLAGSYHPHGEVLRSVSVGPRLAPAARFAGNKQVVRCCWRHAQRELLVTAGEAGLLSVWARADGTEGASRLTHKLDKLHVNRHKPY